MSDEIKIDNPKEHFILHDSLDNITHDVSFSIFKKYVCRAGCQICYIKDDFLTEPEFKKYIPISSNTRSYTDRLMEFLSYFNMAATIDDLRYVKDSHPTLYRFYQEHGQAFWLSSMTDSAIFRHLKIIENDIQVQGLREISISEQFLYKVTQKKLFAALDRIVNKAKLVKVKAILRGGQEDQSAADALMHWCTQNDVRLEKQIEYGAGEAEDSALLAAGNARYSDDRSFTEPTTYNESVSDIYPIHSEALFLMYDAFYSELRSATSEDLSSPFASLDAFDDPYFFLTHVLQGKLNDYRRYVNSIKDTNNVYYRYFKYVVDHLVINRDFNFIPRVAFKNYSTYHRKLVEKGRMVDTQYGLVDPNATSIIPIYSFKDHEPN